MHTCIPSHGLKRSWRSCPRPVNAGNKSTLSMHLPRRRNVTTSVVELKKNSHICKILTQYGEPQRSRWETQKKRFYNLLTTPWTVSNIYAQVARARSCANRVQHIKHLSLATCHVPLGTKGQLSYYVWQSLQGCRFSIIFRFFRYFLPDLFCLFSPISSFSFWTFCLFLCSFSVRRHHTHVDFRLFSQKSSGIPEFKLHLFQLYFFGWKH